MLVKKAILFFLLGSFFYGVLAQDSIRIKLPQKRKIESRNFFKNESNPSGPTLGHFGDYNRNGIKFTLIVEDKNKDDTIRTDSTDLIILAQHYTRAFRRYIEGMTISEVKDTIIISVNQEWYFMIDCVDSFGRFVEGRQISKDDTVLKIRNVDLHTITKLPQQSFTRIDGSNGAFEIYKNRKKLIYVYFWKTSCSGCIKEFSVLEDIYNNFRKDIVIITLNIEETNPKTDEFLEKRNFRWVQGYATDQNRREFVQNALPYGALFDANGDLIQLGFRPHEVKVFLKEQKELKE